MQHYQSLIATLVTRLEEVNRQYSELYYSYMNYLDFLDFLNFLDG